MASAIDKITLRFYPSISRDKMLPAERYIINPYMGDVEGWEDKYRKIEGDLVLLKTAEERQAVDDDEAAADVAAKKARIVKALLGDPLAGLADTVITTEGLAVTVTINSVVVNNVTTIVADPADTKFLMLEYVHSKATGLRVRANIKTTGIYAPLASDELLVSLLGEWSTPANGTELTEI